MQRFTRRLVVACDRNEMHGIPVQSGTKSGIKMAGSVAGFDGKRTANRPIKLSHLKKSKATLRFP